MRTNWNLLQNDCTVCPPHWGMQRQSALFYRVYYILGGTAWCRMAGASFPLVQGTLYILPMMTLYDLWHSVDDPLAVLWFHVQLPEDIFPELVQLPICADTAIAHILQALRQVGSGDAAAAALVDALLTLVQTESSLYGAKTRRMQPVDQWIDAHIDQEIRVEHLAALAGLERSYFSREFHRVMQVSPQRYILAKKMNAAARLLQRGASIAQVAAEVGYLSEKAFSRAFKGYMELPPRDYKKSHIVQP